MQKYFSIPLLCLVISSAIGLLLRWHLLAPIADFQYGNWLHAHSHGMFLGWVFNFLNLVFLYNAFGSKWKPWYKEIFLINQVLILGMFVFFPLQGYGSVTIPLSVIHTIATGVFCFRFFRDTRDRQKETSIRFARQSLVFFLISALGPFALGPVMANDLGGTKWYYFAIYFYLHFQYNGVFIFGLMSVLMKWLDDKGIPFDRKGVHGAGNLLFISIILSYALSLLWADPPEVWNWIGLAGALLQLFAFAELFRLLRHTTVSKGRLLLHATPWLIRLSVAAFLVKGVLQILSAHPLIAELALQNRFFVIAYLHLVLIGVVTFFMMSWYIENGFMRPARPWVIYFVILAFVLSELIMALAPVIPNVAPHGPILLFSVSVLLLSSFTAFSAGFRISEN